MQLIVIGSQNTHHHIGMAINVLCDRVNNNVSAKSQWVRHIRRQKCVVHHQKNTITSLGFVFTQHLNHAGDIGDSQRWVRRGLQPHQFGVFGDIFSKVSSQISHKRSSDSMGVSNLGEITVGSSVHIGSGNDMRANWQRLNNQRGGSRARRKRNGIFGLLQLSHSSLKVVSVGISRSRILVGSNRISRQRLSKRG